MFLDQALGGFRQVDGDNPNIFAKVIFPLQDADRLPQLGGGQRIEWMPGLMQNGCIGNPDVNCGRHVAASLVDGIQSRFLQQLG
jgi:hypothetical protein